MLKSTACECLRELELAYPVSFQMYYACKEVTEEVNQQHRGMGA